MIDPRLSRRSAALGLALAIAWLTPASESFAQATKAPIVPAKEKAKEKVKEKEPVDLNSASAEELMALPGIGEALSRKIIDSRPHKAVADLAGAGVPARTIDGLKGLAVVHPLPSPVEINLDPLVRIETLPGVGPVLGKEILGARPFSGYDDLARVKGLGPAKIDALKGRIKFTTPAPPAHKSKAEMPKGKAEVPRATAEPRTKAVASSGAAGKVDLNTATKAELDALPGIGPVKAQAIVEARPFATIDDVKKVRGIKDGEFAKIKDLITVH